jgi:ABC-type transport system substrate-binding protein
MSSLSPFAFFTTRGVADTVCYETLAYLNRQTFELEPWVAKSWTQTDEAGLEYDVELFDYVYDQAGNHVTADEIVWDFTEQKANGTTGTSQLVSIEATGDYTFHIVLKEAEIGNFDTLMTYVPVITQEAYEASEDGMASQPVSTAHYMVTDYVAGSYCNFTRNDDYWQTDESLRPTGANAAYENLSIQVIQETSQQTIALETGTVDAILSASTDELPKFLEGGQYADDFDVVSYAFEQTLVAFLSGDPNGILVNDINLRKAIGYAVDRQGIIDAVYNGYASPTYVFGNAAQSDCPNYGTEEDYYHYDVDLAKDYLSKSNYDGTALRILTFANAQYERYAQVLAGYLNAVGIQTEINSYDSALYQTYFYDPTQFDIGLTNTGSQYAATAYKNFFSPAGNDGVTSYFAWNDETFIQLCATANGTTTHNQDTVNELAKYYDEQAWGFGFASLTVYNIMRNDLGVDAASVPRTGNGYAAIWQVED